MTLPITRRSLLPAAGALALSLPLASADELKGRMKLTMPAPSSLTDASLNFIALMGVEWITTSGPGGPTYTDEGRVVKQAGDNSEPPWKEEDSGA